jgi:hypothetical protein
MKMLKAAAHNSSGGHDGQQPDEQIKLLVAKRQGLNNSLKPPR